MINKCQCGQAMLERAPSPFSVKFNRVQLVWLNLMYFTSLVAIMLCNLSTVRWCVISAIGHTLAWKILAWN